MASPEREPAPLRRNRSFHILWTGQFAAQLGPGMGAVAYPVILLDLGGTPALTGSVTFLLGVAAVAARLPGGAAADRFDRRALMIVAQGTRMLAMAVLCLGLLTGATWLLWLVVFVALVDVVGHEAYRFAERAALRHIVRPSDLSAAVGQNEARNQIASLIGPVLGGWLMAASRTLPFGAAALGHAVAAIGLLFVRERLQSPRTPAERGAGPRRRVWTEAFSWIWARPELRVLLLSCVTPNLVITGVVLTVVMVGAEAGIGTGQIGTVLGVASLGGIGGALGASALLRRFSARGLVLAALWWLPVTVLATIPLIDHWTVVFPLAAAMAAAPLLSIILGTYQLLNTPDRLQARVGSACTFVTGIAAPLGPLAAGFGLQFAGTLPLFLGFTLLMLVVAVWVSFDPSTRRLSSLPTSPDRAPGNPPDHAPPSAKEVS
ncbi:MFS transporter [Nocardiopsis sp. L17-MgMaSL7]|uniref:MFS transporter n=1 Tax=Nocardiopsis sp. L17-MgMaSL7 TaxID=1938893 RepID=UPI000D70EDFA|nr:MFS transporter [Nocardiopsis sp. L17-MgMaSL7]PWV57408.1 putative MFS family arabinose efflux permease [Nocardiopsis sp. L17-MgMaSL7]